MSEEKVFDILRSSREVPALPQVLVEIIRVTSSEDATPKQLADIILKDPALTSRVLRLVNSSMYAHHNKITTINQAVIALGLRAVKATALSTSMYQVFDGHTGIVDRLRFWRHSLETAIACREIARACGYRPAEEAFVSGLTHDLGLLVMEANFPRQFNGIWERADQEGELLPLEHQTWGTDHARVGRFLMDHWGLPKFLGEAVAAHHTHFSPENPPEHPPARLTCILNLGNSISKFQPYPAPQVSEEIMISIDYLSDHLGISPVALGEIQEKVLDLLPVESRFLDIKIGSVTDLLKAANSLIYKQYMLVEKVLRDNRKMQEQIARDEAKKAALETLKTITATLSHYINNASSTIMGHAQLVSLAIAKKKIEDREGIAENSMNQVMKSVKTISLILEELKKMSSFDTTRYSDATAILDIEDRLTAQIEAIEKET